jgi:CRP/FNR family transcriptional regulator, cyclic AMP receptor protein
MTAMAAAPARESVRVRLVEADPDLFAALAPADLDHARDLAIANAYTSGVGPWSYPAPDDPAVFGLLLLDGLAGARITIPERRHLEIVGPGMVLRPWVALGAAATTPSRVDWRVFEPVRFALLDRAFMNAVSSWPEIPATLADRLVVRMRRLQFQLAARSVTRIDERLHLMLWHLADQWGRVTRSGVTLRLPLTHADLADVVGAARPSVSTALMDLRRAGSLEVGGRGTWKLLGGPPERFWEIQEQVALQPGTAGPLAARSSEG